MNPRELARGTDTYLGARRNDRRSTNKGLQRTGSADGTNYRWINGVVPYDWGDYAGPANAAARAFFLTAMQNWEQAVPGIDFVERTTEGDYVIFRNPNDNVTCWSNAGRIGRNQDLLIDMNGCLNATVIAHELGHTLGLFHEQQRADSGPNINIAWGNLAGCPDTATGPGNCGAAACAANPLACGCSAGDDTCLGAFGNFVTDGTSRVLGAYNFGSLMHYGPRQWAKCNNAAEALPACTTGQRLGITPDNPANQAALDSAGSAITAGDADAVSIMYPVVKLASIAFAPANSQRICTLQGRMDDANTRIAGSASPATSLTNNRGEATVTQTGTFLLSCLVRSAFWMGNYPYPTTVDTGITDNPQFSGVREEWLRYGTLRVLSAGLIPVLLGG